MGGGSGTSFQTTHRFGFNMPSSAWTGLLIRQIAALPHFVVLAILGLVAFLIWIVVQWIILFRAVCAHSAQAERPFHGKPNSDSAPSRTPRSEATRLPC